MESIVTSAPVVFFSKENCIYCDKLQDLLNDMGIPFRKIDITTEMRDDMIAYNESNDASVPQIYIGGRYIKGGYNGFNRLCASSEIFTILAPFNIIPKIDF